MVVGKFQQWINNICSVVEGSPRLASNRTGAVAIVPMPNWDDYGGPGSALTFGHSAKGFWGANLMKLCRYDGGSDGRQEAQLNYTEFNEERWMIWLWYVIIVFGYKVLAFPNKRPGP